MKSPRTMPDSEPGGPIDPYSDYDLHDVLHNRMPEGETTEFYGFHLTNDGGDGYRVRPEGHTGSLATLHASDYDDILELVADLISLWIDWDNYSLQTRVDAAGKVITQDEAKAERDPDLYNYAADVPLEGEA
jgi:hypothetical protein